MSRDAIRERDDLYIALRVCSWQDGTNYTECYCSDFSNVFECYSWGEFGHIDCPAEPFDDFDNLGSCENGAYCFWDYDDNGIKKSYTDCFCFGEAWD